MDNSICPILHNQINLGNNVFHNLLDYSNTTLKKNSVDKDKARNSLLLIDSAIDEKVDLRDECDVSDERKELSSLVVLKPECDLLNKCKDKEGILICIGSLNCDKYFIPIHNKCVHEMGWVKEISLFCSHSCLTNENPNVGHGNDGDVDIVTIKDSMYKFAFKYNENSYDWFQSPKSTIFQLKPLLPTLFSVKPIQICK